MPDTSPSCIPKYLPSELLEPAAATAVAQNPANRPMTNGSESHSILSPSHIAVLTSKWWSSKGVKLTVGFMEATDSALKNRILSHFNAWGEFCNVTFALTQTDPQVRITRALEGYWSYLGTDILHVPKDEPTMCLQAFTMQTSEAEFRRVVRHEVGHCLVGDTLIDCPRDLGKYPRGIPIKDLVGKQPWVYAWKDGQVTVAKASKVWLSKRNVPVVRVRLRPCRGHRPKEKYSPPQELVGTSDHPVMLSDGVTWKNLGDLKPGDRLCSMYRSSHGERSALTWTNMGKPIPEHVFVAEQVYGDRPEAHDCHHINENKLDQTPENLEWKYESDHYRDHMLGRKPSEAAIAALIARNKTRKLTPELSRKMSEAQKNRVRTEEELAELAEKAREQFKGKKQSPELVAKRMAAMRRFYDSGGKSGMYGKTASEETRRKRSESMKATLARKKALAVNHVVVSVEDAGRQDVYDMTVPGPTNFFANGVTVSNSLGCPHEHMRSAIVNRIDVEKAVAYFWATQRWPRAMVMQNVLTPLAEASLLGSPDADDTSIMAYNLPAIITKDGKPIIGGFDFAPQDIEFMAKIYPKATVEPPQPPLPPVGKGLDQSFDFEKKVLYVRMLPGWKVMKMSNQGVIEMACTEFATLAAELESALPAEGVEMDSAKASSLGGLVGAVLNLVAALKSGDINAIIKSVRDLLNVLLGDDNDQVIGFQKQAGLLRLDWSKVISVLIKLLPLILGSQTDA